MGEARRRADQGLPPRQKKTNSTDNSPRIFSWLPITQQQWIQFTGLSIRVGWYGIGLLILIWLVVRFVGPAAGWWVPADAR